MSSIIKSSIFLLAHIYLVHTQIVCQDYCSCGPSFDGVEIKVKCIDAGLTNIPFTLGQNINTLDFSGNELVHLKKLDLLNYTALETLYLTGNHLKRLDEDTFHNQKNLRNLDLADNDLQYIHPNIFANNHVLTTVKLGGNPLVYLPENSPFLISNSITSIDMNTCQLKSINPVTFSTLPNLRALDISHNHMKELDLKSLEFLKELRILYVNNNLWNCDCEIVEVLEWLSKRRQHFGLSRTHRVVKCVENGIYRTLWTAASANRTCNSNTRDIHEPSPLPTTEEESQTAPDIRKRMANLGGKSASDSAGKNRAVSLTKPTRRTVPAVNRTSSWWDTLTQWDTNTIIVFIVLLVMIVISISITLLGVKLVNRLMSSPNEDFKVDKSFERSKRISKVPLLASVICNGDGLKSSRISIDSETHHVYEKIS
ncbi:hypothetical protein C0J52_11441 [Blattella germanica]|nr:hypothetical protein C0J52_28461 [Blattella germanica]PSN36896.1 hypothetical protein C0J52_11441 [Blattella germanica]